MKNSVILTGLLALAGCVAQSKSSPEALIPLDPHSFAQPNRVRVTHVALDLTLDFEARSVRGHVDLELDRRDGDFPVVLDSMGLVIDGVTGVDGNARKFTLGEEREGFGQRLSIDLIPGDHSVRVAYHTKPEAQALQWLAPEQTTGGVQPFLFTQGQAILTRTWIPLQDTPGVRVTYEATVRAPAGLTVVMSAEQKRRTASGAWRFELDKPIPAYLIALACGELASRNVSERCAIWAEPSVVDRAQAEFEDTEAMIASAERLFGPYRWGRYDVIILPPAFPYGGMENPLLTFATPTVIAGDKSLVSLIAHELAHSWSGNLVTNATWRDFWLNEGFTVYFERRIMEEVFGHERAQMEMLLARDDLEREIGSSEPWATVLHIDLDERHPDDGFSSIPYEKGALFVGRLEELFGRNAIDQFLTSWFDSHAFQSVRTTDFEAFLRAELFAVNPGRAAEIDLDLWLRQPGLPGDAPRAESKALTQVEHELDLWRAGLPADELSTDGWVTQQWEHFLAHMPEDLDAGRMADLDAAFAFTRSGNSEILCAWLVLSIRHGYVAAETALEEFLMTVGRRKFLQPLYEELVKSDTGLRQARAIYAKARSRYHAVSTGTIDNIVLP
ncbi:MAG: aminopeptidase [Planctomycetes bacterium]|jgi:aminopeptidase N|nr:aminopeptidase [Planctomycetota bacterium]